MFHKAGDYLWCRLRSSSCGRSAPTRCARARYSTQWHANTLAGATVRKITPIWAFDDFGDALYISLVPAAAVVLGVAVLTAVHWPLMASADRGRCHLPAMSTYMASAYVSPRWRFAVEADSRLGGCSPTRSPASAWSRRERRAARGRAAGPVLEPGGGVWCVPPRDGPAVVQSATMLALCRADRGRALALVAGSDDAGDVAFVITSFFMSIAICARRHPIHTLQRATNDLEDVVAYARMRRLVDRPDLERCALPPERSGSSACALSTRARSRC